MKKENNEAFPALFEIIRYIVNSDAYQKIKLNSSKPIEKTITNEVGTIIRTRSLKNGEFPKLPEDKFDRINEYIIKSKDNIGWKIESIKLQNYRQFYGEQIINLAPDSNDALINIVRGENGFGKTTILNALTWIFYGFEKNITGSTDEAFITNLFAESEGEVLTKASVVLTKEDQKYRLVRRLLGKQSDFTIEQYLTDSWKEIDDKEQVVDMILPQNLHSLFLFNGEHIGEFVQPKNSRNFRETIYSITDLNVLKFLIRTLDRVKNDIIKEIQKKDNVNETADKLIEKINNLDDSISHIDSQINQLRLLENRTSDELDKIDDQLKELSPERGKQLTERRRDLEKSLNKRNQYLENTNQEILWKKLDLIKYLVFTNLESLIEQLPEPEADIRYNIPHDLIKQILEHNECVCGSKLDNVLKSNLSKFLDEKINVTIKEKKEYLEEVEHLQNRLVNKLQEIDEVENRSKALKKEIQNIRTSITNISKQLRDFDDELIEKLERRRTELSTNLTSYKARLIASERQQKRDQKKLSRFKEELDSLTSKLDLIDEDRINLKNTQLLTNYVGELIVQVEKVILNQIQLKVNRYIRQFLEKESFDKVILTKDFEVQVMREEKNFTMKLSAGEQQVLAYSFVATISELSGFEAPLVIDTPFGRLSERPRENLCTYIPQILPSTQITFLMTSTEYTDVVKRILDDKISKRYKLNYEDARRSTFIEVMTE